MITSIESNAREDVEAALRKSYNPTLAEGSWSSKRIKLVSQGRGHIAIRPNMESVRQRIISMLSELGISVLDEKIQLKDRGIPHKQSFIEGKMYVYMFRRGHSEYLKIGKAGSKSKARFYSQHYDPNSSSSNLSKSILLDEKIAKHHKLTVANAPELADAIKNAYDSGYKNNSKFPKLG